MGSFGLEQYHIRQRKWKQYLLRLNNKPAVSTIIVRHDDFLDRDELVRKESLNFPFFKLKLMLNTGIFIYIYIKQCR